MGEHDRHALAPRDELSDVANDALSFTVKDGVEGVVGLPQICVSLAPLHPVWSFGESEAFQPSDVLSGSVNFPAMVVQHLLTHADDTALETAALTVLEVVALLSKLTI